MIETTNPVCAGNAAGLVSSLCLVVDGSKVTLNPLLSQGESSDADGGQLFLSGDVAVGVRPRDDHQKKSRGNPHRSKSQPRRLASLILSEVRRLVPICLASRGYLEPVDWAYAIAYILDSAEPDVRGKLARSHHTNCPRSVPPNRRAIAVDWCRELFCLLAEAAG
ncbi:hypothetical protein QEV83_16080 [Methylocapsa sp. D3K7]|uniref:hypothetical protein n=1 Tax=Methylocapsa sp. D3K7 TaxID=3041435 RepID=UPI00244E99BC|nr:hypothetical protein [Methylocapsa sp. D3K7]WGJ14151.1 hypothetical protein QEV83_16080 [Methylocapsa sp. D3K7]